MHLSPKPRPQSAQCGFTLLEAVVASAVLVVGMLALSSSTWRAHNLRTYSAERRVAENTLRGVAEELRGASRSTRRDNDWAATLLARYGTDTAGAAFDVPGLRPAPGDEQVERLELVFDETSTDADLGVRLGLPRDLNGDGDANDVDVSADATLLPAILRVRWDGKSGVRRADHGFFLLGFGQ